MIVVPTDSSPRRTVRPGRRRGGAAVEFAMVSLWLFLILFGIIEVGQALYVVHILNDTARQAARFANSLTSTQVVNAGYPASDWDAYVTDKVVTPLLARSGLSSAALRDTTGAKVGSPIYRVGSWNTSIPNDTIEDVNLATSPKGVTGDSLNAGQTSYVTYTPGDNITVQLRVKWSDVSWGITKYLTNQSLQGQYTLPRE